MKNEIIIYQPNELASHIEVRVDEDTVWLNRQQIATLFGRDVKTIGKHINNIFLEGELEKDSTVANFATVQAEGDRSVERQIEYYNLDVIISIGYRVKSKEGTQFRIWANKILKDYLLKGYALNNRMNRIEEHVDSLSKKVEGMDLQKHNQQYPSIELLEFSKSHDRFLIIDEVVYHFGASLKDLGKKWFAFSKMEMKAEEIVEKL
jgi:hypothetical protein